MPKVSVIVPAYNHEKYVKEAIDSLLAQTYKDFEILIFDDGSKDHTVDILKIYTDPRITLTVFEENQGAVFATNYLIKQAKGTYIALLNTDDAYYPDKLEKQVAYLDSHPEFAAVFGFAQAMDDDGKDIVPNFEYFEPKEMNKDRLEWLNTFFFKGNFFNHPTIMIRREVYDEIGLYDNRLCQMPDFIEWVKLLFKYEVHIMPEKFIKYRARAGNMNTSSINAKGVADRQRYEYQYFLEQYYNSINDFETLEKIFPHVTNIPYYLKDLRLIKLFIALAIFEADVYGDFYGAIRRLFSLQKIYDLFKVEDYAKLTNDLIGFSYTDLIRLSGQNHLLFTEQDADSISRYKNHRNSPKWKIAVFLSKSLISKAIFKLYRYCKPLILKFKYRNSKQPSQTKRVTYPAIPLTKQLFSICSNNEADFDLANIPYKERIEFVDDSNIIEAIKSTQAEYLILKNSITQIDSSRLEKLLYLSLRYRYSAILMTEFDKTVADEILLSDLIKNLQNNYRYILILNVANYRQVLSELSDTNHNQVFLIQWLGHAIKNGYNFKICKWHDTHEIDVKYRGFQNKGLTIGKYQISNEELELSNSNINGIESHAILPFKDTSPKSKRNVLFALPFILDAGGNHFVRRVVEFIKNKPSDITIITTIDLDTTEFASFGKGDEKYKKISTDIHKLYEKFPNYLEWTNYIEYLIESRQIDTIYIIGCAYFYGLLPHLKQKYPYLKVIDEQFNPVGHIENHVKYNAYIDRTIVENQDMVTFLTSTHNELKNKILVVLSGIDLDKYMRSEKDNLRDRSIFNVLYLGRLSEEKGSDLIPYIAEMYKQRRNIKFSIAGVGNQEDLIKAKILEKSVDGIVEMLGLVDAKTVIRDADILLVPSRFDGRPGVIMEAMAMGVPVIATKVGGIPEMINHNVDGYLVDPGDIEAIQKIISNLFDSPEVLAQLKKNARINAEKNFDEKVMIRKYQDAIDFKK